MVNGQKAKDIPRIGEGKRGVEGYLGYLLRQAAHIQHNRADRALSDLRITPPQFLVLTMLAAYPNRSGADIARVALLTPQTVSVIVANLEKRGAIKRRPHPVHGRIQNLTLTDSGQALLKEARKRMRALERELTAGMTAEEEQLVRRWLVSAALANTGPDR